jgi:hypothetical protein
MQKVYKECYKVLKEKGLMILIVKNFIKQKKVVRLDYNTILLTESCNFALIDRYFREIINPSFLDS